MISYDLIDKNKIITIVFDEVTVFATNNTKIIARGNSIIKVEDDDVEWELYDNASMQDYRAETLEKGKRDGTIKYRGRE